MLDDDPLERVLAGRQPSIASEAGTATCRSPWGKVLKTRLGSSGLFMLRQLRRSASMTSSAEIEVNIIH